MGHPERSAARPKSQALARQRQTEWHQKYTKPPTRAALIIEIEVGGIEYIVIEKFGQRHTEASGDHNNGAEGHGLVSTVHNTLHTAVLYTRALLQAIL